MDDEITIYDILCDLEDAMITFDEAVHYARSVRAYNNIRLPARTVYEMHMRELEFDTPFDGFGGDWRNDPDLIDSAYHRGLLDLDQLHRLTHAAVGDAVQRACREWERTRPEAERFSDEFTAHSQTYAEILGPYDPDDPGPTDKEIWEWFHIAPWPGPGHV